MSDIKMLVISSCTGGKKYKPENQLTQDDFRDQITLAAREEELKQYRLPASQMYKGMQHLRLMEGMKTLRAAFGGDVLDLSIISAGYGLVHEDKEIVPYEVTFSNMTASKIKYWAKHLKLRESLSQKIKGYDLVFFMLGNDYLRALELPLEVNGSSKLLFLASKDSKKLIPNKHPYYLIQVGQDESKSFGYASIGLKGYLFKLLIQEVLRNGKEIFEKISDEPNLLMSLLERYRKEPERAEKLQLFNDPNIQNDPRIEHQKVNKFKFFVPDCDTAKNYGMSLQFFIPECDDRVDPNYNFIKDEPAKVRDPYFHDVYSHEIYPSPNFDGVLISKCNIEESQRKKELVLKLGVHEFIRLPKDLPIMGDCGAFGYIKQHEPPYQTDEILDYYENYGFNYGVSIDHLIVGEYASDPEERKRRLNITKNNAAEFLEKWEKGNRLGKYPFEPIGVAQGWDPLSYRESVADLVAMGYKYIALGGLARTPSKQIFEILKAVRPEIPEYLRVHLFGVARPETLNAFQKLGMTSFDSASYLRRAWLGSGSNYFLGDDKYTAIRVPPVKGNRVKKMIKEGRGTKEQIDELEQDALEALRKFDRGLLSIAETLEIVLAYDELIGEGRERHAEMYRRVLEDRPWNICECKICKELGIEVIIFRGNNRNRRRGFHNTYVFYKKVCKILL